MHHLQLLVINDPDYTPQISLSETEDVSGCILYCHKVFSSGHEQSHNCHTTADKIVSKSNASIVATDFVSTVTFWSPRN